jgi:hypothetical protein
MPHIRLHDEFHEITASTAIYILHPPIQTLHLPPPPQWIPLPNLPTPPVNIISPTQTLFLPPPPHLNYTH